MYTNYRFIKRKTPARILTFNPYFFVNLLYFYTNSTWDNVGKGIEFLPETQICESLYLSNFKLKVYNI